MLTIKYRMTDGAELIQSDIVSVSSNVGEFLPHPEHPPEHPDNQEQLLRRCVTVHFADGMTCTFGPVIAYDAPNDTPRPVGQPVVWVMNGNGATVAKYDLL